jgi:hypothetical protein
MKASTTSAEPSRSGRTAFASAAAVVSVIAVSSYPTLARTYNRAMSNTDGVGTFECDWSANLR